LKKIEKQVVTKGSLRWKMGNKNPSFCLEEPFKFAWGTCFDPFLVIFSGQRAKDLA
jgi:hypothetical protein